MPDHLARLASMIDQRIEELEKDIAGTEEGARNLQKVIEQRRVRVAKMREEVADLRQSKRLLNLDVAYPTEEPDHA